MPKRDPTHKKKSHQNVSNSIFSHLRLCRGLGLRPGQGVFFGFAAHLPTRSRAMTCRWMVVAPGSGAQNALKTGIFWNRKGGIFEKPNSKAENHHLFVSISFPYFDCCHHFLQQFRKISTLFSWHVRTMDGCNMMQKCFECGGLQLT